VTENKAIILDIRENRPYSGRKVNGRCASNLLGGRLLWQAPARSTFNAFTL